VLPDEREDIEGVRRGAGRWTAPVMVRSINDCGVTFTYPVYHINNAKVYRFTAVTSRFRKKGEVIFFT
jgi:hypothetical protein